ncbi:MAG: dihydrolipoyl dehydrogenase [Wenzhouxiangellaceae bacterium]
MTNRQSVEVAIIGAGSAGMRAYREVSKYTDSVRLIEGGSYGTTCAKVGCMPSKLLIAAAEAASAGTHAEAFGVSYDKPRIDGEAVMRRVRSERDRFVGFVVDTVENWPDEHRIRGDAQFVSDHVLQIGDDLQLEAERIIIATGSRSNIIPSLQGLGERLIVNDDIFSWQTLPQSVAVFGAGVIGLELGQALHKLGVRVVLFGHNNNVGPLTDPEVLRVAREVISADMPFYPDAKVSRKTLRNHAVEIEYQHQGETRIEHFDYVLAATGRIPNIDRLALENTSLSLNERGMPEYDAHTCRLGDSHLFMAGDVNNELPLLHEAADEGAIAGYNAAHYPDVRRFKKSAPISVVFSDPQIMMVGRTHRELSEAGVDFETGELDWSDQGRSRVMLINQGLLRVYGERNSGRFLGAEMIGPRAEHLAHLLAWSYQSQLTVSEMLERPFYHPVVEEGVRTALRTLNYALEMGSKPPPRCIDCGPGA